MKCLVTMFFWCICLTVVGQTSDTTDKQKNAAIQLSGYAEIYYQHNSNGPVTNNDMPFVYSYDPSKTLSINLAFVKAAVNKNRVRANLALGLGSYRSANYAGEEGFYKQILEANIGWKLSKKANLWLDAGVFSSPYFETGTKLAYTSPNEKWFLSALVLTGWQRIQME